MSSQDESSPRDEGAGTVTAAKRRRVQVSRACDACRTRKSKCNQNDGVRRPCSSCIAYKTECTFNVPTKKRGIRKQSVEELEDRVRKLEAMLHEQRDSNGFANASSRAEAIDLLSDQSRSVELASERSNVLRHPQEEDKSIETLSEWLEKLRINPLHPRQQFGDSPGMKFVMRTMYKHREPKRPPERARRDFWTPHSWEARDLPFGEGMPRQYSFPESELLLELVESYFRHVNNVYPLLHKPSYFASIHEGLHRYDRGFAKTLLIVCAIGSTWSSDPRVLLPGESSHSAGWEWYRQVDLARKPLVFNPSLYDLQLYCLAANYLQVTSAAHIVCTFIGVGLRLAQELGLHRRQVYARHPTLQDELWKRAFWGLVLSDRWVASELGIPSAMHEEDMDADLPIECDDDDWNDPEKIVLAQKEHRPSQITAFNLMLKLSRIHAFALRTLFAVSKPNASTGDSRREWEQRIVAELDSAMNRWHDSIPNYLRWDTSPSSDIFYTQSAALLVVYYHLQVVFHRPFLAFTGSPGFLHPLAVPSLVICTNAAHAASRVIEAWQRRTGTAPFQMICAFNCGMVALFNIRKGVGDLRRYQDDADRCLAALRVCEGRWQLAGRLWDILKEHYDNSIRELSPELQSLYLRPAEDHATHSGHGLSPGSEEDHSEYSHISPAASSSNLSTLAGSTVVNTPGDSTDSPADQHTSPIGLYSRAEPKATMRFTPGSEHDAVPRAATHVHANSVTHPPPPSFPDTGSDTFVRHDPGLSSYDSSFYFSQTFMDPSLQGLGTNPAVERLPQDYTTSTWSVDADLMPMWSPSNMSVEGWSALFNYSEDSMNASGYPTGYPSTTTNGHD